MLTGGFIKLHRKLVEWEWYSDANAFRVFVHLLLTVNYEPQQWQGITVQRGQRVTSFRKLAAELNITKKTVYNTVNKLVKTGELSYIGNNKYTIITVVNFNEYQQNSAFEERKRNDSGTSTEHQRNSTNAITAAICGNAEQESGTLTERFQNENGKQCKNTRNNKSRNEEKQLMQCDSGFFDTVISDFNSICSSLSPVSLTYQRAHAIQEAQKLLEGMSFAELFKKVEASAFLAGRKSGAGWRCSFDWMMKPENISKIISGSYDDMQRTEETERTYNADDFYT